MNSTFSVRNPNSTYTLHVDNNGVSSAVISVNGTELIGPSDFNPNVSVIEKAVKPALTNTVSVELNGKPGTSLTVTIVGVDNDPPSITELAAPPANVFGWNNTNVAVSFGCADATSGIAFCPLPLSFTNEGANQLVSATAFDFAQNSATINFSLNIDKTAPTIVANASPAANAKGWNNTDANVSFNCADALSGIASCSPAVTFTAEGANQSASGSASDKAGNSASTSASVSIDKTAPTITAQASPAPNANGWNNTNVVVTFNCADSLSGVNDCTSPITASTEGDAQTINGSATDNAGNFANASATLRIDKTAPIVAINSPANGSSVSASKLLVTGSASDDLSGLASVTCNGLPATLSAGSFSCNLSLASGVNSIQVQATDNAGNTAATNISVTYAVTVILDPPPSSVMITPGQMAVLMSDSKQLALVDNLARTIPATWITSDSTIAQVGADGTITPLSPGEVTITGSYQNLSAQAQVFVYAGTAFPAGTVRWFVPALPGNTVLKISTGTSGSDVDRFSEEDGPSGHVIRALGPDGRQKWIYHITPGIGSTASAVRSSTQRGSAQASGTQAHVPYMWQKLQDSVLGHSGAGSKTSSSEAMQAQRPQSAAAGPNGFETRILATAVPDAGGLIMNELDISHHYPFTAQDSVIMLDDSGRELWRRSIVYGSFWWALSHDGTAYLAAMDYDNEKFQLLAVDGKTGNQKFAIPLPGVGPWGDANVGPITVGPDGSAYVEVDYPDNSLVPYGERLRILRVSPEGYQSTTEVANDTFCIFPALTPLEVIPDSGTTAIATWSQWNICKTRTPSPTKVTRIFTDGSLGAGVQYDLPLLEQGYDFDPSSQEGDVVIGENGVGFAKNSADGAVSFNLDTGNINWTWAPSDIAYCKLYGCRHTLSIQEATNRNHLIITDREHTVSGDFTNSSLTLGDAGTVNTDNGYGSGSCTGISQYWPPSQYVPYIISDPLTGLYTIIAPSFTATPPPPPPGCLVESVYQTPPSGVASIAPARALASAVSAAERSSALRESATAIDAVTDEPETEAESAYPRSTLARRFAKAFNG